MVSKISDWREAYGRTAERAKGPSATYSKAYLATVADINTDPFFIFAHKLCPKLGDKHKEDGSALVTRVKLSQVGQTRLYNADVEWSTNHGDPNNDTDPLKRPVVVDIVTVLEQVETFRDGKGQIMINTAGDIQTETTFKPIQNITMAKNVAKVPRWYYTLPGSVNKTSVRIEDVTYEKRTLFLGSSTRPHKVLENEKWYYPITFELKHDIDTHDSFKPSMGYHELVPVPHTQTQVSLAAISGIPIANLDVEYIKNAS